MHLLNAHLVELSESSVILFLLTELIAEFLQMHHYAYAMPTWQSSIELTTEFLSATVSLIHNLASKVFNNLEVFS
jgi:hypothetical protein